MQTLPQTGSRPIRQIAIAGTSPPLPEPSLGVKNRDIMNQNGNRTLGTSGLAFDWQATGQTLQQTTLLRPTTWTTLGQGTCGADQANPSPAIIVNLIPKLTTTTTEHKPCLGTGPNIACPIRKINRACDTRRGGGQGGPPSQSQNRPDDYCRTKIANNKK